MISFLEKALIGAVGALCLGLLKLIGSNFYVDAPSGTALVAYLTYIAYVLLGMAVACYFTEARPEVAKTRQQCFIMGLLAPSILLAIISKNDAGGGSATSGPKSGPQSITQGSPLDLVFGPSAYAGPEAGSGTAGVAVTAHTVPAAPAASSPVTVVEANKLVSDQYIQDGILLALGRSAPRDDFVYVYGRTPDRDKAVQAAASLQTIAARAGEGGVPVRVVQVDPSHFLVVAGAVGSAASAAQVKHQLLDAASLTLQGTPNAAEKKTASVALHGDVYDLRTLMNN